MSERDETADEVIARLRAKLAQVPGGQSFSAGGAGHPHGRTPAPTPNINITLQGDDASELYAFTPKLVEALQRQLRRSPTSVPTSSREAWRRIS